MKRGNSFSHILVISFIIFFSKGVLYGQDNKQKEHSKPEIHWDVQKETDENGNIYRYDSTYTFYWEFPGNNGFNFDSLIRDFQFPFRDYHQWNDFYYDSLYSDHPKYYQDSLFNEFFFDFPFGSHSFIFPFPPFFDMKDLNPLNNPFFFSDSLFGMPFKDPFPEDFLSPQPFPDLEEFFNQRNEMIEKFYNKHPFNKDSVLPDPNYYLPPDTRKKFPKEIEI